MAKAYSIDLRNRVISKHNEGKRVVEIVDGLSVKKTFAYDMLTLYKSTGSVEPKPASGGKRPTIDEECLLLIEALFLETPDIALQEVKEALGLTISISMIRDGINKKLNLRLKKLSLIQVKMIKIHKNL